MGAITYRLAGKMILSIVAFTALFASSFTNLSFVHAQSPAADWEKAAGGKMSFDVVSVKQNTSDEASHVNFPLDGDTYSANGGLFSATSIYLGAYIRFAYKLPLDQYKRLDAQLPKWAFIEFFDIQARAKGNPTKDQMRLMMQSLLADRFRLKVHTETQQLPVFMLALEKPGKTGPGLQPHPDTMPCADPAAVSSRSLDEPTPLCGVLLAKRSPGNTDVGFGMRKVSAQQITSFLGILGNLDRPLLNRTGLVGDFDVTIEYATEIPPGSDLQADPAAPTFLEALKDQLGLKLEPAIGPVNVLVIDHLEEPSPN
jgi:uncharacterized protein (TIGR03435 family)